jgi:RNase P/RNase MRP subunit p29
MPKRNGADTPLSRGEREALAGEILGAPVSIPASRGLAHRVEGTIVDESLSTLSVRVPGRTRPVRVPKAGLTGTLVLPSGELPLKGDALRVRPEDRTKRMLAFGPRRFR